MADTISANKYCVSMTEKVLRYTDDQRAWTPNNIRRLFISPNMVAAQLHIGQLRRQAFVPQKYSACVFDAKYVSMTSALGGRNGTNICSHLEELVYCTQGVNGEALHPSEADWRLIVSSTKAANTEEALKKSIGERFKRLRGIIIYQGTISDFMKEYQAKLGDALIQVSDIIAKEGNSRATVIDIHKSDWFKGFFFRPSHYPADVESGQLCKRLHAVEEKLAAWQAESKKADAKDSVLKGYETKFETSFNRFKSVYSDYKAIALKLLNKNKISYLYSTHTDGFKLADMSKYSGKVIFDYFSKVPEGMVEDLGRLGIKVTKSKQDATSEGIRESIELLDSMASLYYCNLVVNYLNLFISLRKYELEMFVRRFFNSSILLPQGDYLNGLEVDKLSDVWTDKSGKHSIAKSMEVMTGVMTDICLK